MYFVFRVQKKDSKKRPLCRISMILGEDNELGVSVYVFYSVFLSLKHY